MTGKRCSISLGKCVIPCGLLQITVSVAPDGALLIRPTRAVIRKNKKARDIARAFTLLEVITYVLRFRYPEYPDPASGFSPSAVPVSVGCYESLRFQR